MGSDQCGSTPLDPVPNTMTIKLLRGLIVVAGVCGALGLAALLVWFVQGSAEAFPTGEQDEKVRLVAGLAAVLLLGVEVALVLVFRRLR